MQPAGADPVNRSKSCHEMMAMMKIQRAAVFWFVALAVSHCAAVTRHYYIAAEDVSWN